MAAFAILDVREVLYQIDESRTGIAVLAVGAALGDVSAAGLAFQVASRTGSPD
jgi:hypothetical protein